MLGKSIGAHGRKKQTELFALGWPGQPEVVCKLNSLSIHQANSPRESMTLAGRGRWLTTDTSPRFGQGVQMAQVGTLLQHPVQSSVRHNFLVVLSFEWLENVEWEGQKGFPQGSAEFVIGWLI